MIPILEFNHKLFIDKTTVLFGVTGSGKSSIVVDILYHLKPYIDQIIVIAPTDMQNHTYSSGLVPLPYIHYKITPHLLGEIWERQNAFVSVYAKANNQTILEQLFKRIPENPGASAVTEIRKKLETYSAELYKTQPSESIARAKISDMSKECNKMINTIYKHIIRKNIHILSNMNLSDDEKYSVKYINFNPKLCIILDDCTDMLNSYKNLPAVQKLFYQGRWAEITLIIACHTDKALLTEIKKNIFVSIYTDEPVARAYFLRPGPSITPDYKKYIIDLLKQVFTPMEKYQKLIYIRDEDKFYRRTAIIHEPFTFGSDIIRKYGEKISVVANALPVNNKYLSNFQ
jgi:hypothetical protein